MIKNLRFIKLFVKCYEITFREKYIQFYMSKLFRITYSAYVNLKNH